MRKLYYCTIQKLLAAYLFQHKKCPLPNIGALEIKFADAIVIAGEKKIIAPKPAIQFTFHRYDASPLTAFIAANKYISADEAAAELNNFCNEVNELRNGMQKEIPGAGYFSKDIDDKLLFTPVTLPAAFLPDVNAQRVIHPDKSHAILVGDKETDSTAMTEYFAEESPAAKQRWWLWAAVFFIIALLTAMFYLNDENKNSFFGIAHQQTAQPASKTYRKLP